MSVEGHIPTTAEVRERIDRCGDEHYRACLRATFLMCARISEVVGVSSPGDTGPDYTARGPTGEDAVAEYYEAPNPYDKDRQLKEKALVISVKTAKRRGMIRRIGLPADHDPWVRETAKYFWNNNGNQKEPVFPFTRQALWMYMESNQVFEGLTWMVKDYSILLAPAKRDNEGNLLQKADSKFVKEHLKRFTVHSLRDVRATQLIMEYDFDGTDIAIHGGWAISQAEAGVSTVMSRYINLYETWQRPFKKLLPSKPNGTA